MSASFSFLRRVFQRISKPTGYVGRDLEGNRYYEHPNPNDSSRTKRVVKYKKGDDMWTYVAGKKRLSVQWTAWLSHTRPHAPTYEELLADTERRRRLQHNVALIEARDREARETAQLNAPESSSQQRVPNAGFHNANAPPQQTESSIPPTSHRASVNVQETTQPSQPPPKPDPWEAASSKGSSDEPQAWTPRAVRRGA